MTTLRPIPPMGALAIMAAEVAAKRSPAGKLEHATSMYWGGLGAICPQRRGFAMPGTAADEYYRIIDAIAEQHRGR